MGNISSGLFSYDCTSLLKRHGYQLPETPSRNVNPNIKHGPGREGPSHINAFLLVDMTSAAPGFRGPQAVLESSQEPKSRCMSDTRGEKHEGMSEAQLLDIKLVSSPVVRRPVSREAAREPTTRDRGVCI
ncbi:hypothetical protein H113_05204 [Trichophyton rubrum MR1459]|nr:hypothetical protein H113_05204 [Trichophyton rubrum MR1459]EZG05260.1 hypothetical protein H106_05003 [Trichophyton rubrum CBS 735.88]KMQ45848.1 hypothetical protein HL42_3486 [Trichophyton rubrum]